MSGYLGSLGNLINPQAINLTRANAYAAAKIVLGTAAPQAELIKVATNYTNYIVPRVNRAQSVQQILGDTQFSVFTSQASDHSGEGAAASQIKRTESQVASTFGPAEAPLGVPNWLLYGGVAVAGYFYYRKKHPSAFTPAAATMVPKVQP